MVQSASIALPFGPRYREVSVGEMVQLSPDSPLTLDCGVTLPSFPVAYQTYGTLNAARNNAVMICHALTGDQYIAGKHPVTGKPGWWEEMVGPGKPIDTNRFFVICTNVLGGCMGSLGPKTINPETGNPYGPDFPTVTIGDMVEAQRHLLDHLHIETLAAVIGGSMGGMQVLCWAARYPELVFAAIPIATAPRHSPQNIAFHEIGRQAIMADTDWCEGHYMRERRYPTRGLAVARMTAHITYMSEAALQAKFGRRLRSKDADHLRTEPEFQVESYLRHQGASFVERFDPNSYVCITRAMDYFDLAEEYGGQLSAAFHHSPTRFCILAFASDWCFPPSQSRILVHALSAAGAPVSYVELDSPRGHDAFLLKDKQYFDTLAGFLQHVGQERGL